MGENNKMTKGNQSLGKALSIVEVMADQSGDMRLQDIAKKAGINTSTALRFLNTLIDTGYAKQDEDTLKYQLTMKFCKIGYQINKQNKLREIVRPHLVELSRACKESSSFVIEQGNEVIYADVIDGADNILRATQRIGKIAPLYCTGVGKLFLLEREPKDLAHYIDITEFYAYTDHTFVTPESFHTELDTIRSQGYALDNEECELGVMCVAAPIYDYTHKTIACISVSGPSDRITRKITAIVSIVTKTAATISKQLGYE